jgi:nucleolar complex protein 2
MGKLGKKARKFAKKNLQSVEKRSRKLKPFIKKKFAKSKLFFAFTSLMFPF